MQNRHFFRLFLILSLGVTNLYSQTNKNNIVTVDGRSITGIISINKDNKTIISEVKGEKKTFPYAAVSSVILEDKKYEVLETKNSGYELLFELVPGNARLYRDLDKNIYLKTEANDLRKLNLKNFTQLRGYLLFYFSDCAPVRTEINNLSRITTSTVIDLSQQYNNCDYSKGFTISLEELERSESKPRDFFSYYFGTGYYTNTLSLNPGSAVKTNGNLLLNGGVKFSPGFLGKVRETLSFSVNVDYLFKIEDTYNTSSTGRAKIGSSAIKTLAGIDYTFNKENAWQPYIGVSGGLVFVNYNVEYIDSQEFENLLPTDTTKEFLNFAAEPEIGLIYSLSEKSALNLSLRYVPKSQRQLTTFKTLTIPLTAEENGFIVTFRYHFL